MAEYFICELSEKDKNIIKQINIEKDFDPFTNFHSPWKSFDENAYEYIYKSILKVSSKNSVELAIKSAKIINKILDQSIERLSKNMNIKNFNKIIWLRYRTVNNNYDEPRWHIDGNYNINNMTIEKIKNQKKIIISLIGPGTLILDCEKEINEEIDNKLLELYETYPRYDKHDNLNIENAKKINDEISNYLDSCHIKKLENFNGVIYNIGRYHKKQMDSSIHSEPKFDKPRLFLGLVLNEI